MPPPCLNLSAYAFVTLDRLAERREALRRHAAWPGRCLVFGGRQARGA